MKMELLLLKERVEKARADLSSQSNLWYWYHKNHLRPIKNYFSSEGSRITEVDALGLILKKIDDLQKETNEKKILENIGSINAMLLPALEEADRVLRIGEVVDRIDRLRNSETDKQIIDLLNKYYDECINSYQLGQKAPDIIKLSNGSYALERSIQEGSDESGIEDAATSESQIIKKLSALKLNGRYTGKLQNTLDDLIEKLSESVTPDDVLSDRVAFWDKYSRHADAIESRIAQAVESMESVDIEEIPPELLIVTLRAYRHFFADFPLKLSLENNRLIPG
ncbi:MAG: hypothetical protein JW779_14950 [Candidatus Thorarchaeota archaeon]|nr:hypothetical protein [Candidatus Thorarchaeota archaeon]